MGRPVKYRTMNVDAEIDRQLKFQAWFTGEVGPSNARMIKQVSTNGYLLVDENDETLVGICNLVANNDLAEGKCTLVATKYDSVSIVYGIGSVEDVTLGEVLADDIYNFTLQGGTSTESAVVRITIGGGVITDTTVTAYGIYSVVPANPVTMTTVGGDTLTCDVVWIEDTAEETTTEYVSKLTQNKVYTFDDGRYDYILGDETPETGDVQLATFTLA